MIVSFDSIKDSLINHPCKIPNDVGLNFQAVLELYSSTISSNFNPIFIPLPRNTTFTSFQAVLELYYCTIQSTEIK